MTQQTAKRLDVLTKVLAVLGVIATTALISFSTALAYSGRLSEIRTEIILLRADLTSYKAIVAAGTSDRWTRSNEEVVWQEVRSILTRLFPDEHIPRLGELVPTPP